MLILLNCQFNKTANKAIEQKVNTPLIDQNKQTNKKTE